ncbi:SpoVA/SpoVAEb family sporulation membrane protein [Calidifontibacillus erzurumensis]|uniref:SpoVA/SpoVAEb family sporulation membrane protein n=1 Tax=Calidifontibacillus erzurumensis TaxID=2741433 RepID=A0A8J8GBM8_9BACI|nr:SpoVA/SpoVAEb family sporulation membrane protein [Calidifontibacillus erzurumensis]NSL50457.1 SpoVA/SpoVAEb family sporulation membrane protein [Calidifontibacillus erzurumensis]
MEYFLAFLFGGLMCLVGQILLDQWKLSPSHVMSIFVVVGVILGGLGVYDEFIELAGVGAILPITSIGYSLLNGALIGASEFGVNGLTFGMFHLTSIAITSTILFAFIAAIIFNPKG